MTNILQRLRGCGQSLREVGVGVVLIGLTAGCGSKGAVSLNARVDSPSVTVEMSPLTATVSVVFDLVLELGSVAPQATTVELGNFALKRDETSLIDPLELSSEPSFPVELDPGDSSRVAFQAEQAAELALVETGLCAGELWISGTVTDSLSDGRPTPASSVRFFGTCP